MVSHIARAGNQEKDSKIDKNRQTQQPPVLTSPDPHGVGWHPPSGADLRPKIEDAVEGSSTPLRGEASQESSRVSNVHPQPPARSLWSMLWGAEVAILGEVRGATSGVVALFDVMLGAVPAGSNFSLDVVLQDSNSDLSTQQMVTVSVSGSVPQTPEPATQLLLATGFLVPFAVRRKPKLFEI
jgi:hypothetical protein